MLPFAPEGYPFVLVPALAGIVAWAFGAPAVAAVCWVAMLACVAFFRDPARVSAAPPEVVLAPADGKVLSVGSAPAAMAGDRAPAADLDLHVPGERAREPGPDLRHRARGPSHRGRQAARLPRQGLGAQRAQLRAPRGRAGNRGVQADRRLAGAQGRV